MIHDTCTLYIPTYIYFIPTILVHMHVLYLLCHIPTSPYNFMQSFLHAHIYLLWSHFWLFLESLFIIFFHMHMYTSYLPVLHINVYTILMKGCMHKASCAIPGPGDEARIDSSVIYSITGYYSKSCKVVCAVMLSLGRPILLSLLVLTILTLTISSSYMHSTWFACPK